MDYQALLAGRVAVIRTHWTTFAIALVIGVSFAFTATSFVFQKQIDTENARIILLAEQAKTGGTASKADFSPAASLGLPYEIDWPRTAGLFLAGIVLIGLIAFFWPRGAIGTRVQSHTINRLAVRVVHADIDTRNLDKDLVLRVSFLVFNGTSEALTASQIKGQMGFGAMDTQDGAFSGLPNPSLNSTDGRIPAYGEGFVHFDQRTPRDIANQMLTLIDGAGAVFDLDALSIFLSDGTDQMPLSLYPWDRLRVNIWDAHIHTGRIIRGRIEARLQITASTDT